MFFLLERRRVFPRTFVRSVKQKATPNPDGRNILWFTFVLNVPRRSITGLALPFKHATPEITRKRNTLYRVIDVSFARVSFRVTPVQQCCFILEPPLCPASSTSPCSDTENNFVARTWKLWKNSTRTAIRSSGYPAAVTRTKQTRIAF